MWQMILTTGYKVTLVKKVAVLGDGRVQYGK